MSLVSNLLLIVISYLYWFSLNVVINPNYHKIIILIITIVKYKYILLQNANKYILLQALIYNI